MIKAFANLYGAFLVTNLWADMIMAHEMTQTKTLQNAAIAANVEHVVLSTLEDMRLVINAAANKDTWSVLEEGLGSYVPHFDGKGAAGQEFLASAAPTTLLYKCFYYNNFIIFGMGPKKHAKDQPASITFPTSDGGIPMCSVPDIGRRVVSILKDPETINTETGVVGSWHTGQEITTFLTRSLGRMLSSMRLILPSMPSLAFQEQQIWPTCFASGFPTSLFVMILILRRNLLVAMWTLLKDGYRPTRLHLNRYITQSTV